MIGEANMVGAMRDDQREQNNLRKAYQDAYKYMNDSQFGAYGQGRIPGDIHVPLVTAPSPESFGIRGGRSVPLQRDPSQDMIAARTDMIRAIANKYLAQRRQVGDLQSRLTQLPRGTPEYIDTANMLKLAEQELGEVHSGLGSALRDRAETPDERELARTALQGGDIQ